MEFQASLPSISLQLTPPDTGPSLCFSQSTQARNWLLTRNGLKEIRSQVYNEAIQSLSDLWREEDRLRQQQQQQNGNGNGTGTETNGSASSSSSALNPTRLDFPSMDQCQVLVDFYLAKIPPIVRVFNKPTIVETTAMSYLKRFYTKFTPWQHNVKDAMLTCLYLALKSTNHPLSLSQYSHKVAGKEQTPESVKEVQKAILGLEFSLSQALDFQYWVLDPTKGVGGLLMGLRSLDPPPSPELLSSLLPQALQNLSTCRLTDLEFHFSPSQIMIASFKSISEESSSLVDRWIDVLEERAIEGKMEMLESRRKWREQDSKRNRENHQDGSAGSKDHRLERGGGNSEGIDSHQMNGNASGNGTDADLDLKEDELIDKPLGISREELNDILNQIQKVIKKKNEEIQREKSKEGKEELLSRVKEINRKCEALIDPREEKVGGSLYLKRISETESQQQTKRSKKLERSAKRDEEDDPFAMDKDSNFGSSSKASGLAQGLDVEIKPGSGGGGGGLFGSEIAKMRKEK